MLNFINIFVLVVSIKRRERDNWFSPKHIPFENRAVKQPREIQAAVRDLSMWHLGETSVLTQTMVICAELG